MSHDLGLEYFPSYFAFAPAALALRECVRLAALRETELQQPILDVGCGDGIFARLAYPDAQVWGIDINPIEVRRAQATAAYRTLICGSIVTTDLPVGYFKSAIANCSLEHVPDVMNAFRTIHRSLAPDAPFVLIVPTPEWTRQLLVPRILGRVGLGVAADWYRNGLDRVFHHVHLYDDTKWTAMLGECGFDVVKIDKIVSPGAAVAFDLLLYPSVTGWVTKALTGHWTMFPKLRRLFAGLPREIIRAIATAVPDDASTAPGEYFIVAKKRT